MVACHAYQLAKTVSAETAINRANAHICTPVSHHQHVLVSGTQTKQQHAAGTNQHYNRVSSEHLKSKHLSKACNRSDYVRRYTWQAAAADNCIAGGW